MNTANADLIQRVARLEAFVLGDHNEPKEMTVTEAARQLGVPRRTVGNWATTGRCPSRLWRGQRYIPRDWVADQLITRNPINQENET